MRYYSGDPERIDYFREEYFFLSNFYPARMILDGIMYRSAEAAYQAQKTLDPERRARFGRLSPDEAKQEGNALPPRPDWTEIRYEVMRRVVFEKFTQNPHLARWLVDTGDKPLIEGNTWGDVYWGIDLRTGEGKNRLGVLLTELRERFAKQGLPSPENAPKTERYGPFCGMYVDDGDITLSDCDCIVNAANETLMGGGGVDGAIHRAAGPELLEACEKLGGCRPGEAKITGGCLLRAKYVIHTVGPRYPCKDHEKLLRDCYYGSLTLARENGAHSVAFPAISTGKFGYPREQASNVAVSSVYEWLTAHAGYEMRVDFICPDQEIFDFVRAALERICPAEAEDDDG